MKKGNISSAPVKKVKKDYFTGPVTLREISGITKPSEHDMYHVIFKKSARTKIHFHTGAQMLIVTIPPTEQGTGSGDVIPGWIKNNAGWWADGQIDDGSFVSGLQWLISNGIMKIS